MQEGQSFLFYIMTTSLNFAVYLAILQLGVRTFVDELTQSFQGISNTILPGAVPGIDVAATFGFGSPNAVTIGFLFGALGQFLMIGLLILLKSPTIVIAGFIPLFFDNAVTAVYANNRGGFKAACLFPFSFWNHTNRRFSIIRYMDRDVNIRWLYRDVRLGDSLAIIYSSHESPRLCWNRRSRHWSIGYSAVTISEKS